MSNISYKPTLEAITDGNISGSGTIIDPIILKNQISVEAITSSFLLNGQNVVASGDYSHAEGRNAIASGDYSHAEGYSTITNGLHSHAEGYYTTASGFASHAEGTYTTASGSYSHAEGDQSISNGNSSHAEGLATIASGSYSHAEGDQTIAFGEFSHTEGERTEAYGSHSHAEGTYTFTYAPYSHAEGQDTITRGTSSHVEGYYTETNGLYSHAEGSGTSATGFASHTEGLSTETIGSYSHAEGQNTVAEGQSSHAEGLGTIAIAQYQHVQGQYNAPDLNALAIVGNGISDEARSNILEIYSNMLVVSGNVFVENILTASNIYNNKDITVYSEKDIKLETGYNSNIYIGRGDEPTYEILIGDTRTGPVDIIGEDISLTGATRIVALGDKNVYILSPSIEIGNQFDFASIKLYGEVTSSGGFTGSLYGTSSYSSNSDKLDSYESSQFAMTSSNIFIGNQTITGSVFVTTNISGSSITGSSAKLNYIDFNTNIANQPFNVGRLSYNQDTGDLKFDLPNDTTSVNLGQQLILKVKNNTASAISKGKIIRISGSQGSSDLLYAVTASWDDDPQSANTLGVLMSDLSASETGYALLSGMLTGINTIEFTAGQLLYLSSSGNFTSTAPVPPKHAVRIGHVGREQTNNGSIFVRIQNGYELDELHDVLISNMSSAGDLLVKDSDGLWKNNKVLSGSYEISGSLSIGNVLKAPQFTKTINDPGQVGQICWDDNYIYIYTSTNIWKSSSLN